MSQRLDRLTLPNNTTTAKNPPPKSQSQLHCRPQTLTTTLLPPLISPISTRQPPRSHAPLRIPLPPSPTPLRPHNHHLTPLPTHSTLIKTLHRRPSRRPHLNIIQSLNTPPPPLTPTPTPTPTSPSTSAPLAQFASRDAGHAVPFIRRLECVGGGRGGGIGPA